MVGGDFQKPLQPLAAYGYCVFEDVVCVDPSDASDGRPTYANITFSEFLLGLAQIDQRSWMRLCCCPFFQSSVMGLRAPLGWRLLGLRRPRREAEMKGNFERVNADFVLSLIFPSSSSLPILLPLSS